MLFNSFQYLLFLPTVVSLCWLLPARHRWVLLLGASYFFYMCWKPEYVLLILASTIIDYWAAQRMGQHVERRKRKRYLFLSLLTNLGLLFTFKYYAFGTKSIEGAAHFLGFDWSSPALLLLLPVGISFYTFQTIGYSIDVYLGRRKPESHLGHFALYVAFFPQLVAGPIERSESLLPQLKENFQVTYDNTAAGLYLILWGMCKKVVIADRLGILVDQVYQDPVQCSGPLLLLATVFFSFQILCDFSGYTDIARGSARLLGVNLMVNFRSPYFAVSPSDFWKRWHISLSSWFRDYLYIPLGGNRVGIARWSYNIMLTFLLSGLWHGANWTFVVWGVVHGVLLLGERLMRYYFPSLETRSAAAQGICKIGAMLTTFSFVTLTWVFFRANSLSDAWYVLSHIGTGWQNWVASVADINYTISLKSPFEGRYYILISCAFIVFLESIHLWLGERQIDQALIQLAACWRWLFLVCLGVLLLNFGTAVEVPFIYFQF